MRKAVQIFHAYDDPTVEGNWALFDAFVTGTFTMNGLISGRRAYIKGRYLWPDEKSGWSDMVSIMVP